MTREKQLRLNYKVERSQPGVVYPGTDHEPIVTITVRGATFRYRLISYVLKQTDAVSWEGDPSLAVIDDVDAWVNDHLPSLLMEADVHHTIQFRTGSRCYYDFQSQTLYGGDGYREKAGSSDGTRKNTAAINGEAFKLPESMIPFIELLTKTPGAEYKDGIFLGDTEDKAADDTRLARKKLSQRFYKFKRYDSSIKATFRRENMRFFKYVGNPQVWRVGGEGENGALTLEKIFKIVAQHDIIAIFDPLKRQLITTLPSDISPEEAMAFLGLNEVLFDPHAMDAGRFFGDTYCASVDALKALLTRYCTMLEAIWNQLRGNIKDNLSRSLSASTFYHDTNEMPLRGADLNGYSVPEGRLFNSLRRVSPAVRELIQSTEVGAALFRHCDLDILSEQDRVIDGIVALVLACFSDCRTGSNDEELIQLMGKYQDRLRRLIRQKFNYSPPPMGDGENSQLDEIRRGLKQLLEQAKADGLDYYVAAISKIYDPQNLGYDDDNGLQPPTK